MILNLERQVIRIHIEIFSIQYYSKLKNLGDLYLIQNDVWMEKFYLNNVRDCKKYIRIHDFYSQLSIQIKLQMMIKDQEKNEEFKNKRNQRWRNLFIKRNLFRKRNPLENIKIPGKINVLKKLYV